MPPPTTTTASATTTTTTRERASCRPQSVNIPTHPVAFASFPSFLPSFIPSFIPSSLAAAEAEDSTAADEGDRPDRSRWAALALEVAISRGLCSLAEAAQRFTAEPRASASAAAVPNAPAGAAEGTASTPADPAPPDAERAASTVGGEDEDAARADEASAAGGGRAGSTGKAASGTERRRSMPDGRAGTTAAARAAVLIAAGCKAGEAGAHPTQKTNGAVLEGLAWSLAGRGAVEGVSLREGGSGGASSAGVCLKRVWPET